MPIPDSPSGIANTLPQELIELILFFLWTKDDIYLPPYKLLHATPTTIACALVCRCWLPAARNQAFHSVDLKTTPKALQFIEASVRRLQVPQPHGQWDMSVVLKALDIDNFLPRLEELLVLRQCQVQSALDYIGPIRRCRGLETLEISGCGGKSGVVDQYPPPLHGSMGLRTLNCPRMMEFNQWVSKNADMFPAIEKIVIPVSSDLPSEHIAILQDFIRRFSHCLRAVHFVWVDYYDHSDWDAFYDDEDPPPRRPSDGLKPYSAILPPLREISFLDLPLDLTLRSLLRQGFDFSRSEVIRACGTKWISLDQVDIEAIIAVCDKVVCLREMRLECNARMERMVRKWALEKLQPRLGPGVRVVTCKFKVDSDEF
ncbi:hypothetical protein DL96DRAFT_1812699 [Flagelloscypha sp. PMI_526]|nr:hypothetical protein DL96DRAFT_1812699 [Flagelloscypha sp. PMI_526]